MAVDRTWYELRALHARPPGLAAADPDRRAVVAAALRQSEELFAASRAVTHASKPLPLFYALSQAGRAIAAAHDATPTWNIKGHGLRVKRAGDDVAATTVGPAARNDGADAFSAVTRAIGSDALPQPLSIAELWAALPELEWLMGMRRDALPAILISTAESGQCVVQLEWPAAPPAHLPPATKAFRAMHDVAIGWHGRWYLQPLAGVSASL